MLPGGCRHSPGFFKTMETRHINFEDTLCRECGLPAIGAETDICIHCRNVPRGPRTAKLREIQLSNNTAIADAEEHTPARLAA